MADDASTNEQQPAENTNEAQGDPVLGDGGKKALAEERAARKAADKANADLSARLKAIEDRDLSELQKAQRDLEDATKSAASARSEALRFRLAAAHGISDEDAETFLTGSDEGTVKRQAERLVALRTAAAAPGTPRPDLSQGATTPLALNDDDGLRKAIFTKLNIGS